MAREKNRRRQTPLIARANSHRLFDSSVGPLAVAWNERGLVGVQLPESSAKKTVERLAARANSSADLGATAPKWVERVVESMRALLSGAPADFSAVPLDDGKIPEFHSRVYAALRRVPQGQTRTYGELAVAAGSPDAARAVGQAMRKNPWPLVVPCHRVLAADGRLCGFSAAGGLELKATLLRAESAIPAQKRRALKPKTLQAKAKTLDPKVALRHLRKSDARLSTLIDRVPYTLASATVGTTLEALLRTIVYQQLNGKAAATIHGRVLDLLPGKRVEANALLSIEPTRLRAAGLSHAKIAAARDLAQRAANGEIPSLAELSLMDDEAIVERLSEVRGIGRWSVEMLLMFWLGRPDVLPLGDFGVRQGFMHLMGRKEQPSAEQLERHAERWRPYRSVASWYMWRAVDEARAALAEKPAPTSRKLSKAR